MSLLKDMLSFSEVATELDCEPSVVRRLVVEEKTLPAVYVTLVGHVEPFNLQMIKVDDSGQAFDLCGGFENLPHVGYVRVKCKALEKFFKQKNIVIGTNKVKEKPLGTRERDTLLTIIAALAKDAKIDIAHASKAAASIENLTETMGTPVSRRAIEEHLKKIPDALEIRMK